MIYSSFGGYSSSPPINDYKTDASKALDRQVRQDFGTIVGDKELFWALFCNTMCEVHKESAKVNCRKEKNIVTLSTRHHGYSSIRASIEAIRQLVEVGLKEKRSVVLLPIHDSMSNHIYLKEPSRTPIEIDTRQGDILDMFFNDWVRPVIQPCIQQLGAICTLQQVTQVVVRRFDEMQTTKTKVIEGYALEWDKKVHLIYPIPPLKPTAGPDLKSALYAQYNQQLALCDLTLVAKDDKTLKVHSAVVHAYGGEALQQLVTQSMEEAKEKTLDFSQFSIEVLLLFAEFLYLGPAEFTELLHARNEADGHGFALFEFASAWQISPLVDCITNLLSVATLDDQTREAVAILADRYNNDHLKRILQHYHQQAPLEPALYDVD